MPETFQPFNGFVPATFVSRPNRFCITCDLDGTRVTAFLPNPGRLQELLLPGRIVYLVREAGPSRQIPFTAVAVLKAGIPVLLHTIRTNDVARHLLENRMIPGLEEVTIERSEVAFGRSRFDFLCRRGGRRLLLEVKSCTLTGKETAMFPDAVTARGRRHLLELSEHAEQGSEAAVLFIVHNPSARLFMPDYHTDLAFSRTLLAVRDRVRLFPVAVRWEADLSLGEEVRLLTIPWEYIEAEAKDRGTYLVLLEVSRETTVPVGSLGRVVFRKGFYLYVGSAMANLARRLDRHRRRRKSFHWHIDYLRHASELLAAFPVRSSVRLECAVAKAVAAIADWSVAGFGSSDCDCPTHLFGMAEDPRQSESFQSVLQYFRMDRHGLARPADE